MCALFQQPLTLQTLPAGSLPALAPGAQGHLLVKTDSGQYQLVRVNTASAGQMAPNGTPTTANTVVLQQNAGFRPQNTQVRNIRIIRIR